MCYCDGFKSCLRHCSCVAYCPSICVYYYVAEGDGDDGVDDMNPDDDEDEYAKYDDGAHDADGNE